MRLGRCLWVALIVAAFVGCDDTNDVRHLDAWVDTPLADADVDAAPVDAANVTVAASASTGGTVLVSEETGGSCSGTSCTLATGASKVTFTPVPDAGYRFDSWTGASCVGYTASAGDAITFENPIADHACTATFIATVEVVAVAGTGGSVVASAVTGGVCTGTACTLDAGASTVTFTPTANANYAFAGWVGCTGYTQSGNSITFTNPTNAKTCTANFGATVVVAATAGTGGTVAASGVTGGSCVGTSCTLDRGASTVTFTATANANYRFVGWSGCSTSTNAAITITNSTTNQTCTATFTQTVVVSASAGTGGSVAASNISGGSCTGTNCTLDSGASSVTFTATPSSNYRFGGWSGCSNSTNAAITIANATANQTCTATFVAIVTVSATAGTGGTVTASNVSGGTCSGTSCTLDSGSSTVTFTAAPNANYRLGSWSGASCTGYTANGNSITFSNPASAKACTANFVATVNVSATAGTGGTVAASAITGGTCTGTNCTLDSGAGTVTFTPTANANYRFDTWSGCIGYTQSGNAITFTNTTAARSCTANFVAVVSVSATAGSGGSVAAFGVSGGTCSGTNCTLDSGASAVTFTATPSANYRLGSWTGATCTGYTTSGNSITFTNPTAAKACTVSFVATVNVVASTGPGGTIAASAITGGTCQGTDCTLDSGSSTVTFTPTAGSGYRFNGWSGASCTGYTQSGNSITFTNPASAKSCSANWFVTVSVSATASTGGSVTASNISGGTCSGTSCTLDSGASTVTFTPSATSGYRFVSWTGATCTGYSQNGNAITFSNPTAAKACTANFAATVTVIGSAGTGGSVSVSALSGGSCSGTTCTVDSGNSSVTFLATPSANYRFGSWSGCSSSTNPSVTLSNPTVSTTCTATFVATVPIDAVPMPAAGGSISVTNLSNGTCSGSSCALDSGNSTVQFTPVAAGNFRFTGWSGNECFGYFQGSGNSIIFSNPTSARSCIANFIEQVTVEATVSGNGFVDTTSVSNGTCTGTACVFDSGTGSVTFIPTPQQGYRFVKWSGATCTGYNSLGDRITFNNPTSSHKCIANFELAVEIEVTDIVGLGAVNVTFVSNGTCDGAMFPSCILSSGAGTVTFTPTPQQGWHFQKWFNCDGYTMNQQTFAITFTNPTTYKGCVASFSQQ